MYFHGTRKVRGSVRVRSWELVNGVWVLAHDTRDHNLVVNAGLDLLAEGEQSNAVKTQVTYVALGNGTTGVTASDTALGDERFRKQVTSYALGGTGEVTTTVYVSPSEANGFVINEIGWFAGDASDAVGSGVLMARIEEGSNANLPLFSGAAKTNAQTVQIDRTTTYS